MSDELIQQAEKAKSILAACKKISEGRAKDNIDLSILYSVADTIASMCFAGGSMSPAQMIARKDAYDFIVANSRLASSVALTRSDYYAYAARVSDIASERVDYVRAVAQILNSAGIEYV